jgi:hypothetical protein
MSIISPTMPCFGRKQLIQPPPGVAAIRSPFTRRLRNRGDFQVFTADPSEKPADFGPSLVEATSSAAGGPTLLPQAIWFGVRGITESLLRIHRLEYSPSRSSSDLGSRRREATQPLPKPAGGAASNRRSVVIAGGQAGDPSKSLREVGVDGGGPPRSSRDSPSC